jgi:hypothetical protein
MTRDDLDRVLDPRGMVGIEKPMTYGATTEYSVVRDAAGQPRRT